MKRRKQIFLPLLFLLLSTSTVRAQQDGALDSLRAIRGDPALQAQLAEIVNAAAAQVFGNGHGLPKDLNQLFEKPAAVFVTLRKGEEVRGCMGTLFAREGSFAGEIAANLRKALLFDPWHRPVARDEISGMEVFLTATGKREAVRSIGEVSPARDGVMIRQGSKEAVVLPGEAKTQRYLLAFLKAKAGIKGGPFQLYRLKTETVSVILK